MEQLLFQAYSVQILIHSDQRFFFFLSHFESGTLIITKLQGKMSAESTKDRLQIKKIKIVSQKIGNIGNNDYFGIFFKKTVIFIFIILTVFLITRIDG